MIDEKKLIEKIQERIEIHKKDYQAFKNYSGDRKIKDIAKWDECTVISDLIKNQPKVGEWIPVSERLPNDIAIHEVTARFRNGIVYTEFAYYDELREEWWKFDDDSIVNVIAWKETSEPYKE